MFEYKLLTGRLIIIHRSEVLPILGNWRTIAFFLAFGIVFYFLLNMLYNNLFLPALSAAICISTILSLLLWQSATLIISFLKRKYRLKFAIYSLIISIPAGFFATYLGQNLVQYYFAGVPNMMELPKIWYLFNGVIVEIAITVYGIYILPAVFYSIKEIHSAPRVVLSPAVERIHRDRETTNPLADPGFDSEATYNHKHQSADTKMGIIFEIDGQTFPIDELILMKASGVYVEYSLRGRSLLSRKSLEKAASDFNDSVGLRCHRSYWVNRSHIVRLQQPNTALQFVMSDGTLVPISLSQKAKANFWFNNTSPD